MTPQELKNSILELALQGKLVEQRPEEGSAGELYCQIQEEKERLVKEGKIKKEKPLPEITEEEEPFEIPKAWKWGTIGACCDLYTGNSISEIEKKAKYQGCTEGYSYIGTKNVSFNHDVSYDNGVRIPFNTDFKIAYKGSILMCIEGGSAGKKIAVLNRNVCFGNKLCMFNSNDADIVLNMYLYYYLQSTEFKRTFKDNMTGIIGGVSIRKIKNISIPLPPLEEQKRIVAKIEELMPLVDHYKKAWDKLQNLDKEFPVNMQKSILKMAFEGRLVPQNDSEEQVGPSETISNLFGPANVNGPFDIPDSWRWSTLGGCCEMYTGNSISESEKKAKYQGREEGYDYIGTKDVSFNHDINYNNGIKIPFDNNFKIAHGNSVLMCIEGGSAGKKIAILDHDVCFGNKLCMFKANAVSNTYLYYWLQSTEFKKAFTVNMTGIIGGVSIKKLKSLPIPLPPLSEQRRIVAKIEELMPLVDRYKKAWSAIDPKENVF